MCSSGRVLVHCIMGMSRSSTLVLAYLMIYRHLTLKRALQELIQKRAIYPNRNFLALLLDLDLQLTRKKKTCQILWSEGHPPPPPVARSLGLPGDVLGIWFNIWCLCLQKHEHLSQFINGNLLKGSWTGCTIKYNDVLELMVTGSRFKG